MDLVSIFRKDMMKKAPLSKMVTPYKSRLAWIIMLWSRPIFFSCNQLIKSRGNSSPREATDAWFSVNALKATLALQLKLHKILPKLFKLFSTCPF